MNCDNCLNTTDNETCDLTGDTYPLARSCREWAHRPGSPTSFPPEPPAEEPPPPDAHARHATKGPFTVGAEKPPCQCAQKAPQRPPESPECTPQVPGHPHGVSTQQKTFWGYVDEETGDGVLYEDEEVANRMWSEFGADRLFVQMKLANEDEILEAEREAALAKLTPREREILGLED